MIKIWTDGSASQAGKPGGWAFVVLHPDGKRLQKFGSQPSATNNSMELMAAVEALEFFETPANITVYSDSMYIIEGVTKWCNAWIKNGWVSKSKTEVANIDLWTKLIVLDLFHNVKWQWVKGHANNPNNHVADRLAHAARLQGISEQISAHRTRRHATPVLMTIKGDPTNYINSIGKTTKKISKRHSQFNRSTDIASLKAHSVKRLKNKVNAVLGLEIAISWHQKYAQRAFTKEARDLHYAAITAFERLKRERSF